MLVPTIWQKHLTSASRKSFDTQTTTSSPIFYNSSYLERGAGLYPLLLRDNTASYIYGPGGLLVEQVQGSTPYYYHPDQLGSIRALTDASGTVQNTYQYDAYGTTTSGTGSVANPFRYAGEYRDSESGLYYLRARYYDPATQQFLTRDSLLTELPYAYVDGSPLNAVDPSGLDPWPGWLGNPFGGGLTGGGGGLLGATYFENKTDWNGQARLGKPTTQGPYYWDRSFHLDKHPPGSRFGTSPHLNADYGILSWIAKIKYPPHLAVPKWIYNLGSTKALRGLGTALGLLGLALDAYDIATAGPCDRGRAIGGAIGGWVGAWLGAGIGSALAPGIGTFIGGFIGGVVGGALGEAVGHYGYDLRRR